LRSSQHGALYVFDEPSTGLHPIDVATLVGVFDRLLEAGATIIVIDHDLDLLAVADHLIDMGPGGGPDGGHIVAAGPPPDGAPAPGRRGRTGQRDRPVAGRAPRPASVTMTRRERWARARRSLWQPPRPHGEQPHERVVGPLELFYDLAVVVLVAEAARHLAG